MEHRQSIILAEPLNEKGVFTPKSYYKNRLLYSGQKDAVAQENLGRAMQNYKIPVYLMQMQKKDGGIIVFDGCHRVGIAIMNDYPIPYELLPFDPNIRYWPFNLFMREFKKYLGMANGLFEF